MATGYTEIPRGWFEPLRFNLQLPDPLSSSPFVTYVCNVFCDYLFQHAANEIHCLPMYPFLTCLGTIILHPSSFEKLINFGKLNCKLLSTTTRSNYLKEKLIHQMERNDVSTLFHPSFNYYPLFTRDFRGIIFNRTIPKSALSVSSILLAADDPGE